jgi:hypothetical protein
MRFLSSECQIQAEGLATSEIYSYIYIYIYIYIWARGSMLLRPSCLNTTIVSVCSFVCVTARLSTADVYVTLRYVVAGCVMLCYMHRTILIGLGSMAMEMVVTYFNLSCYETISNL